MVAKPNLLVVGDYNRKDFLDLFIKCKDDFNFYFIEFASFKEVKNPYYKEYGKAIFWKQYTDAFSLLEVIKPNKVVFFFIESYNHVALNVACREQNITTYHLEHGIRDYRRAEAIEKFARAAGKASMIGRVIRSMPLALTIVKTQLFFWRTVKKVEGDAKVFLEDYFKIRSKHSIFETFNLVKSPFRLADIYISFSLSIFKAHQIADHLRTDQKVFFIGIPYFDKWADLEPAQTQEPIVLFIDQAFVKEGLLGWNQVFKETFVNELYSICGINGYSLFVKVHPKEDARVWNIAQEQNKLRVVDNQEFEELLVKAKVVMGFYSTLLMPLAAMPHTTVITLENHPVQGIFPSDFLVNSGVAHAVHKLSELASVFNKINEYHKQQYNNKQTFTGEWLYKLDGNSGKRLREILIEN